MEVVKKNWEEKLLSGHPKFKKLEKEYILLIESENISYSYKNVEKIIFNRKNFKKINNNNLKKIMNKKKYMNNIMSKWLITYMKCGKFDLARTYIDKFFSLSFIINNKNDNINLFYEEMNFIINKFDDFYTNHII